MASLFRACPEGSGSSAIIAKLSILGLAAGAAYLSYDLLRCFFQEYVLLKSPGEGAHPDADALAKLRLLNALQKYSGTKVYGPLRIPEYGNSRHVEIDLVIVTCRKVYVVEIKNWSGVVRREADGSWSHSCKDGSSINHENVFKETQRKVALLESYISRRGLKLILALLQGMVVIANQDCRVEKVALSQPEVLSLEQFESLLARETKKDMFTWMKSMSPKKKKTIPTAVSQKLHFILGTAPTWDRLVLEEQDILGTFMHFEGPSEDLQVLEPVKRSRVSVFRVLHNGSDTTVEVHCSVRDYRLEKKKTESFLVKANPHATVIFQVIGASSPQEFLLKDILRVQLSA